MDETGWLKAPNSATGERETDLPGVGPGAAFVDVGDSPDAFERVFLAGSDWADPEAMWLTGPDERSMPIELMDALIARAVASVESLQLVDAAGLDKATSERWALGVERLRRQIDDAAVRVADHVDVDRPFRKDGFFTAKAWLKHRLQLSGLEAHRRIQVARMHRRLPVWASAHGAGLVGVAQAQLMANVAANPRIEPDVLAEGSWNLLHDAMDLSYEKFEANLRRWESLADAQGAADQAERNRIRRDAMIRPRDDGGWNLTASFDGVAGAEFNDIFAHYIDAESRADWAEADARVAGKATVLDLRRTEAQRRADALLAMARAAASAPPWSKTPLPTVNYLIDHETFESVLKGERVEPARYRDIVCRTQAGHELHTADVVNTALWAHIRRVVYDASSVVIDLGRRSRVFTGSAREAVMLLAAQCAWVGCDMPVSWCQADHSIAWRATGATVPRNGDPLCGRHNRLKECGYRVVRDSNGDWHTYDPDGNEIL